MTEQKMGPELKIIRSNPMLNRLWESAKDLNRYLSEEQFVEKNSPRLEEYRQLRRALIDSICEINRWPQETEPETQE